jgi:hypothetical protein
VTRPLIVAVMLTALSLAIPGAGSAAPASTTFSVVGYEYAFTQTLGCFAGTANGAAGDDGAWSACVQHDPLGSTPTYVNGGTFVMTTAGPGIKVDAAKGTFALHGGTITSIDPGAGCTNQQYLVTGTLRDVSTITSGAGTGSFRVVLTHSRISILGHCVIYKARVAGTVSFGY